MANPILVEVTRDPEQGRFVESVHRGAVAVVSAGGQVLMSLGDIETPMCPRSTLKPLQALALLESGAIEHFDLGEKEIALACASHSGEPTHTTTVAEWLRKIDCSIDMFECGPHLPVHEGSAHRLIEARHKPNALHNNCSGKHTGFMTLARHMGVDVAGYTKLDHPVQQLIASVIGEMVGYDVSAHPVGPDGCNAPNYALPLTSLAHGLARLGRTESLSPKRASAASAMLGAIEHHPHLIAGEGRVCTRLVPHLIGGGLVKSGAEGCYGAVLPKLGVGVALKVDDGAGRASGLVLAHVINRLGCLDASNEDLGDILEPEVVNTVGRTVGGMNVSANLLEVAVEGLEA